VAALVPLLPPFPKTKLVNVGITVGLERTKMKVDVGVSDGVAVFSGVGVGVSVGVRVGNTAAV